MSSTGLRGRPLAVTNYAQDMGLLNTPAKRRSTLAIVIASFGLPFLLTNDLLLVLTLGLIASVGAIGLNLVTGYAGQVSLGHAFFIGLGAYTGAVLGGDPDAAVRGYGLPLYVWLPAAGVVAAIAGLLVGPIAVRLRGLYLAIVTLGLVFLGDHIFREAREFTGGPGVGRRGPKLEAFGIDFTTTGTYLGVELSREQLQFFMALVFLIIFAVLARNIARSGIGRAFSAVRDRDVAAAVVGVDLTKYKIMAFAMSSFYAGVTGALYYAVVGVFEPNTFGLLLSIQYLAMILIGGVATITGSIMGALFVTSLGRISGEIASFMPFISTTSGSSGLLTVFQLEAILYGLLIVGFLIFEPRGLFGIWMRIRNYWKGWPFSY
ncbi:branched-chain amino acid ABC transporter, permease protein [Aeromicrobium marinum DSM 15272]|uniref:Branched-chain amino acid ABC transporter, permease protein n=1 Tax=Aeromicrobium marinum DSM 15272 TaxID=585531 RepID=E2S8P0_9ACTN|nr:branched-chain amino acid ABC transporter permease [Aeromicrobium marinum]EFQ84545.1 branched-chain amino acid ABC transporter, permease protein [Aeromicrobium marinum DSM 15272]